MTDLYVEPAVRSFIDSHRVARLATADSMGNPHVIPVCYAFDGHHIYTALDLKPKRVEGHRLKRVRNIVSNPSVALVIDDYAEDWTTLAYVLIRGQAKILESREQQHAAESMLRDKYPQYQELLQEGCTILPITPERIIGWGRL